MCRVARRKDVAIAAALQVVDQVVQHQPNVGENDGSRVLETFKMNHLPIFKGRYNPDRVQTWFKEIDRIFRVMDFL